MRNEHKKPASVIFDMGGVLVDLDREACINAFCHIGFDDVQYYIGDFIQSDLFLQFEEGYLSESGFFDAVREHLSSPATDAQIRLAWNAFLLSISEEKLQMLLDLRKRYRVFLLSNTNPIHFKTITERFFMKNGHTLSDYFERCYLSYECHLSKPDPEFFRYVISQSNICPENTLFVDDGKKNIEIAHSLGFQVYWAQSDDLSDVVQSYLF